MRMIIDSFLPIGFTEIAVDSIFMMPQLGVLSTFHESAAVEVFHKDCLIKLGTCVAPIGKFNVDKVLFNYIINVHDTIYEGEVKYGEIKLLDIPVGTYDCKIELDKNVDLGFGKGQTFEGSINGGEVGIVFDGRGREISFNNDNSERINQINKWSSATNEYNEE